MTTRRWIAATIVAVVLLGLDLRQTPAQQWTTYTALAGVGLYQASLSKWYERIGVRCRFTVTCSDYGEVCLRRFGAARGGWLAMKRVLRCGPWTPLGTVDAPPAST